MDITVLDEKLASLRPMARAARGDIQRLRDGLDAKIAEANRLEAQIAVLEELRVEIDEVHSSKSGGASRPRGDQKPSEAVISFLAEYPDCSMHVILDNLDGVTDTTALNERHVLRTTLRNLVNSGKVIKDEDGNYSLPER